MLKATQRHTQIDANLLESVKSLFNDLAFFKIHTLFDCESCFEPILLQKGKKLITVKDTLAVHGEVQLL